MKFTVGLLVVLTFFYPSIGQESRSIDDWLKVLSYGVGNQTNATELSDEEVLARNDYCLPQEFVSCSLLLGNETVLEKISAKYDYRGNIVLINHNDKNLIAAPNMIKEIKFSYQQKEFKLINVTQMGRSFGRKGFYEVLLEDEENKLVSHRFVETFLPSYNATVDAGVKDTIYSEKKEFLIFDSQKLYPLENFKSKTLGQFDEKANPLKAYIKKEKLKFKEEEDLKRFAQFLWSL
ncbi:MAG: hypothetical protein ABJE80_17620 [Reichenbachiella sp.]|uniref:hypothetical protein n=1 Tax=Reichenbachiella sp. TaxID=2184521 RepID=UPI003265D9C9